MTEIEYGRRGQLLRLRGRSIAWVPPLLLFAGIVLLDLNTTERFRIITWIVLVPGSAAAICGVWATGAFAVLAVVTYIAVDSAWPGQYQAGLGDFVLVALGGLMATIASGVRLRSAADTALVVDLHADGEAWQYVVERGLDCGPNTAVYGRVAGAPGRRGVAEASYMKAVATLLRSGQRPPLPALHEQAWARVAESGANRDLVLAIPGGAAPGPPFAHPPVVDPHTAISSAVRGGRHGEADVLAAEHERLAVAACGPASDAALHWAEVRADLAMFAGDPVRSCRAWLGVAGVRLGAGQAADSPAVEAAADRAHHQWGRIAEAASARELGPALAELRLRVPGRRQGALEDVRQHLRQLQAAP
ncbi:hypothetical protein AB0L75_05685 [Streptomyces sp. NPDC052101]|uniref:hypothetical protein n=1 Tax=Streptomyces sp. NPDC052101 TaxID=3155763 RepID=UPI00342DBDE5